MSDYYSYKPLKRLERSVAIVGFPGCRPMQTARVASMVTGIPILMLPRAVSHMLGRTPEGLILKGELDELARAERTAMQQALAGGKHKILALGSTTLDDPMSRRWVQQRAQIVYLSQPLEDALAEIEDEMKHDIRKHRHLDAYAPITVDRLRPIFDKRTKLFRELADVEVPIDKRKPLGVGRSLPDLLGWEAVAAG